MSGPLLAAVLAAIAGTTGGQTSANERSLERSSTTGSSVSSSSAFPPSSSVATTHTSSTSSRQALTTGFSTVSRTTSIASTIAMPTAVLTTASTRTFRTVHPPLDSAFSDGADRISWTKILISASFAGLVAFVSLVVLVMAYVKRWWIGRNRRAVKTIVQRDMWAPLIDNDVDLHSSHHIDSAAPDAWSNRKPWNVGDSISYSGMVNKADRGYGTTANIRASGTLTEMQPPMGHEDDDTMALNLDEYFTGTVDVSQGQCLETTALTSV